GGDAGEVLDAQARATYRARVRELRAACDEADQWNDTARATRLREELDALGAELARAEGLGARARRVGSAAERARVNVQRRLTAALRRIADASPDLGRHLAVAVRTGVYCSYVPGRVTRS